MPNLALIDEAGGYGTPKFQIGQNSGSSAVFRRAWATVSSIKVKFGVEEHITAGLWSCDKFHPNLVKGLSVAVLPVLQ